MATNLKSIVGAFSKVLSVPSSLFSQVVMFVVIVALIVFWLNPGYLPKLGMSGGRATSSNGGEAKSANAGVQPIQTSPEEQYTKVQGMATDTHGLAPSCNGGAKVDPSDLLPKDKNSEWAKLNPHGAGELADVNPLKSGHHIGVNTVGNTMRNANLSIRSEPPNPQANVGPWNQTTIEPDLQRKTID